MIQRWCRYQSLQLIFLLVAGSFAGMIFAGVGESAVIGAPHYRQTESFGQLEYQRGLEALAADSFDEAEQAFSRVLDEHPQHLGALVGLAELEMKKGNDVQARTHLQKALHLAPQQAGVQRAWSRFLMTQGNFQEAALALKKAIASEPMLPELYVDLGHLYFSKLHDYRQAIEAYRAALSRNANLPDVQYSLGGALMMVGEWEAAQAAFQETIRLAPGSPLPHQALGRLFAIRKKFPKALQAFDRALSLRPTFFQARIGRGDVYAAQGQMEQALAEYRLAEYDAPSYAPLQSKLGLLYQHKNHLQKAAEAFQKAIRLDPTQAMAYNNLAWIATEQHGKPDEALVWAQKAVALDPDEVAYQDTLGWVYRMRGELRDAANVLERAAKMEPQVPEVFYHLGVVYAEQREKGKALAAFKRALAISEDFPEATDTRRRIGLLDSP